MDQVLLRREVPLSGTISDISVVIADLKKRYGSEDNTARRWNTTASQSRM